jgi:hypothetical protein
MATDFHKESTMKSTRSLTFVKFAVCAVLVAGLSASALASCGDSLSAIAPGAATIVDQSGPTQQDSHSSAGYTVNSSIVGLWHIQFKVNDQTIQEAYQLWNAGGTEVHNPNVDPRTGNVCLGVWKQASGTYTLAHRVWNYDANGTFLGTIHLSEKLTLGHGGNTHSGSFKLDFYDRNGHFVNEVTGSVTGKRISVQ